MRKVNLKVAADQEVFEYYNIAEEELKPYWEVASDNYEMSTRYQGWGKEEWEEDEFFFYQLREYEKKHFTGKRWEEVDPIIRDVWSDLYKDAYGVRPYHIPFECVV